MVVVGEVGSTSSLWVCSVSQPQDASSWQGHFPTFFQLRVALWSLSHQECWARYFFTWLTNIFESCQKTRRFILSHAPKVFQLFWLLKQKKLNDHPSSDKSALRLQDQNWLPRHIHEVPLRGISLQLPGTRLISMTSHGLLEQTLPFRIF